MKVGFTGTQKGLTDRQLLGLTSRLRHPSTTILHHGDCTGADETAHDIMVAFGKPVEVHPPTDEKKRAFCASLHPDSVIHPPEDYQVRNRAIVEQTDYLIACPKGPETSESGHLVPYSGTWSTVRYARQVGKTVVIIWPDGRVHQEV